MKKLILLVLALFSVNAYASGLYYDPDRNGEGILILDSDAFIVGYFYTYGAVECDNVRPPQVSPAPPADPDALCTENAQRWFFFSDQNVEGGASGVLYSAFGVNYPDGEFNQDNPFGVIVGMPFEVGTYFLRPWYGGYQMVVVGGDIEDPLYQRVFNFTTKIFPNE